MLKMPCLHRRTFYLKIFLKKCLKSNKKYSYKTYFKNIRSLTSQLNYYNYVFDSFESYDVCEN